MTSIITWNVNGIRAIAKKGFIEWLAKEGPDILCVQESKARPEQLDQELLSPEGYQSYWKAAQRPGYSGVATYTKQPPLEERSLGVEEFDNEGRVQILTYSQFTLINAYFPNSQEKGKRLDYKQAFCNTILDLCDELRAKGQHIVLCGDYNVAHKPIDLKDPERNEGSPGYFPEERAWMDRFVDAGYVDTFRLFTQEGEHYTWWSYRSRARERNAGWRIDYHCVNEELVPQIKDCVIMDQVFGSDHCPVKLIVNL